MADNLVSTVRKDMKDYKITVLLVDDQAFVGETVRRMLEDDEVKNMLGGKQLDFHFCQDPSSALKTAEMINPTVILQDLVMPDIPGMTLVKFYRAHSALKDVPVIVLSSKEEATTKAELFASGANDYLVKLPDKIELIARILYHSRGYIHLLERNDAYKALEASRAALLKELDKAGNYVKSLLPDEIHEGDITTVWNFTPSEQLGGDAFGYHWIDEDTFAVYLLDVCGHGVGSALMGVSALNSLRSQTIGNTDFKDPVSVMNSLNANYQMADHNELYFTIWYGVFNRKTRILEYSSGGHPPAMLLTPSGEKQNLIAENFIIGGLSEFPFSKKSTEIKTGSKLYIFSDGAYEIEKQDGKMWSYQEMFDFIAENNQPDGSEISMLYNFVQELGGSQTLDDDFSMLLVNF